ncbi:hypothetical protein EW093_16705 [Thiospirochaeta perfilievii]|uniref:Transposase n=1 Tax=Thiospirochaeta perfilievii TaxID=252967 RepID=A0A5C1QGQ2_9SPIO|nr:hypothetical protein [Thiospirochaeta perfilievii]QEN04148.1 hypothetical protein EW093_05335 [Thiospirochaeta perfilievii]QEN04203.1 hypothetical protein EW093_05615 [Thiospirochaeta perfilievii]QEN06259.1 hypothetical protein EW093_16705 [Thiospirochaeta perfilievii]
MKSKYTLEERKQLVIEQQKSGLTITEFTKQKNIKQTTFQNWLRRLKETESEKFVKVKLKSEKPLEPTLLMINSIKLEIPATVSSSKIAQIISVIREI